MSAWRLWLVILLACLLCGSYGCSKKTDKNLPPVKETIKKETPKTSVYGGTLIIGRPYDAINLDPALVIDRESAEVVYHIFDTLTKYNFDKKRIEPSLATAWSSSRGGLVWKFRLRKGVKFHDGSPFNAQAVKFNFDRLFNPGNPFHSPKYGKFLWRGFLFSGDDPVISRVTAKDNYIVEITLKKPDKSFPKILSIYSFAMVSPSAVKKYKDDFTSHPCGTGPFKFIEWRGGDRIVLEANKDYWGRTAYLDRLIFETVSDADARARNLERNRIDVMTGLRNEDIDDFKKNDDLKILEKSGFAVVFLALNSKEDYLDSAKVRISLAYAINKKRLLKSKFKERALIAKGFLPPGVTGYAPEIKSQEFSPSKARKYLDKTIFYDGFDLELIYPDDSSLCFPEPEFIANSLKDDFKYLKINLKPKALDNESFWRKILAGDFSAALLGLSSPDSGGGTMLALINNIFYEEKNFELLLDEARNTEVEQEEKKLYKDMQKDIVKDLQIIPLFYPRYYAAYGKRIKGMRILPNGICVFKDASIEK